MKGMVIILGSLNDSRGNLSDIAIGRNTRGIEEYRSHQGYKIMVTGGFGSHFNRTDQPHAFYAKKFLLKKGIPKEDIVEFAKSHDTIQDALLSKKIVDKYQVKKIIVVSSDFHLKRVRYIFKKVFSDCYLNGHLRFSEATTDCGEKEKEALDAHEKGALEKMKRKGIPHLKPESLGESPGENP